MRGTVIDRELVPVRSSPILQPALPRTSREADAHAGVTVIVPFSEAEWRAILRALDTTGWRISGRGGAAQILGLKPTTLHAKMKKLGIQRPSVYQPA